MNILRNILIVCGLILFCNPILRSASHFTYTPLARSAYESVIKLKFGEAYPKLAKLKLEDPENLIVHHIEDHIDFFRLYISEDEDLYDQLKGNRTRRIKAIESGDKNSPYYLFLQADIRLHWALIRLRFEEYLPAFTEINRANKLLEKNQEAHPDFMPNLKDLAILHAMVGTIPDGYQWSIRLLSSLKGTIEQGLEEMEQVISYANKNDFVFTKEAQAMQAYLLLHLANKPEEAWQAISSSDLQPKESPLHAFVMANIAMRTSHNDEAIALLEEAPQDVAFHSLPFLDFMLGLSKLRRLDQDAGIHFEHYLEKFHGLHYIKEAYQKLAWQALINGDAIAYRKYMLLVSDKGTASGGGDRNAQIEADAGRTPHVELLRARLLFDGGYTQKAYNKLAPLRLDQSKDRILRLEAAYRMGRILQELNRKPEALVYFQKVLEDGYNLPYFFACNAALQCGLIYEEGNDEQLAKQYFKKCLVLNPDEYTAGMHQKAKAGLARLRKSKGD